MGSINLKVIEELRSLQSPSSPHFLRELIDLFLQEAEGHVARLHAALDTKDAQGFERSAHTLKGSSGNLGALALSKMCAELQGVGRAADWTRATAVLPVLDSEFKAVKAELEVEKNRK